MSFGLFLRSRVQVGSVILQERMSGELLFLIRTAVLRVLQKERV